MMDMNAAPHVATLGTGPLTGSVWFAQLVISFMFAAGFITYYRQIWRYVLSLHKDKPVITWVARIVIVLAAIGVGTALHMVGWLVFTNASGLMFHNMGLFVLTFILLDEHTTWWEFLIRVAGIADVWEMHHMGYFARPEFAISVIGAALGMFVLWRWRVQIRYRIWRHFLAFLYLGSCFWLLLPPHSAGLTITPVIIMQALVMYLVMVMVTAIQLAHDHRIDLQNAANAQMAQYDQLTNAKSASIYRRDVTRFFKEAHDDGHHLTVAAIDIDHFKQINDHYGHLVGDDVLIGVASTIDHALRANPGTHSLYRTGGEEFSIVFLDQSLHAVQAIVTAVWEAVQQQRFDAGDYSVRTTLSIGVAELMPGDTRFDDVYARADASLYQSKHNGRNAITINDRTINKRVDHHVMATRTLISQNVLTSTDLQAPPIAQEVLLARYEYGHDRWNFPKVFVIPLAVQLNYITDLLDAGGCPRIMMHLTERQFAGQATLDILKDYCAKHAELVNLQVELDFHCSTLQLAAWAPRYHAAGIEVGMINVDGQQPLMAFAERLPYLNAMKISCDVMRKLYPNGFTPADIANWQRYVGRLPVRFVVSGIENSVDAEFAVKVLKAPYLQGYYFDRPELPRLA